MKKFNVSVTEKEIRKALEKILGDDELIDDLRDDIGPEEIES